MINLMTKVFLKGLLTLLPLVLSIYLLAWCISGLEKITNHLLLWFLPDFLYVPGMGILLGLILVFALGLVMEIPMARYIHEKLEVPFTSVPLVKSIYFSIKDLAAFVVPTDGHRRGQAVMVRIPNFDLRLIGIMTRSDTEGLPPDLFGMVAVYMPMSYQIGGFVMFVPKAWVEPIEMNVEEAMRHTLTAWMPTPSNRRPPT
jgi:uncharacterized membrane protein